MLHPFVFPAVNSHVINFVLQNIHLVVRFMLEITIVKLSVQQTTPFDIEDSRIILHCTVCLKYIDNINSARNSTPVTCSKNTAT